MNFSQLLFPDNWLDPTSIGERIAMLDAPEVVRKISSSKAASIAGKIPDCQKLIKKSSSDWSVCSDRYLFIFSKEKEEGLQKVSVWGKKLTGVYIRLKTVWTKLDDDILEAVPYFVSAYFDIDVPLSSMCSDSGVLEDLEDELKYLLHHPTVAVKGKEKLLRHWSEFLPDFISAVTESAISPKSPDGGSQPPIHSGKDFSPKNPNNDSWPPKSPIEELMPSGRPVSIEEFNEALWRADYADDTFREADRILYEKENFENQDSDFLEAAILYDSLMGHEDFKAKRGTAFNRRDRLIKLGNRILAKWNGKDDWSEQEFRDFNAFVRLHSFMEELGESKISNAISKNAFRSIAYVIMKKKIPFGIEMATLLIHTRSVCKRLPKDLSDFIKDFLLDEAMTDSAWDCVVDDNNTYQRLRKLYNISKALDLLNYSVEKSYTSRLMNREQNSEDLTHDTLTMLAFCQLLPDYNWQGTDKGFLTRLYSLIYDMQADPLSDIDTLRLASAKLLILRKLGKSPFSPSHSSHITPPYLDRGSHEVRTLPSREAVSEGSCAPPKPVQTSESDLLKSFPDEWTEKAAECVEKVFLEGSDVVTFCKDNNLPFEDFNRYFDLLMDKVYDIGLAHENALKTDAEYRNREIEMWKKRKDQLYEEMEEANNRLKKILDELDTVHHHLHRLSQM